MVSIKLLMDSGSDIQAMTHTGYALIYIAAECGQVEILKLLLSKGVDTSSLTGTWIALQLAIKHRRSSAAKLFVETGLDVNIPSLEGFTSIFIAIEFNDLEILDLLLQNGADLIISCGAQDITPLMIASHHDSIGLVEKLILQGLAAVNSQSIRGHTALHLASAKGHLPVVDLLLRQGADADIMSVDLSTLLNYAAQQQRRGDVI